MRCLQVEPHLAAYVDGELDAASRAAVEGHLQECRGCREAVRDMRLASAVLGKWKSVRPTAPMVEVLRRRIRRELARPGEEVPPAREEPAVARRTWVRPAALLAAASALIVFSLVYLLWDSSSTDRARTSSESVSAIGKAAARVSDVRDLRGAGAALHGVISDQWASPRPDVDALVQLEVVSTMIATATDARQGGDVGRILNMLSGEKLAVRPRVTDWAPAAGDTLLSLFATGAAFAQEPPTELGPLLEEAIRLEEDGDLEGALKKYRTAGEDRVLALRANIMQANVDMKLGRVDEAVQALDRAYKLTRPDTFYREVVDELRDRADRAIELQRRIDELKAELLKTQSDFDVMSDIGNLQVKAGNLRGAEETFDGIVRGFGDGRHEKGVLRARLLKAWCRREMNQHGAAFDEFTRLIGDARNAYPEVSALAQFERAKTLHLRKRYVQAVDDYRDLAENTPGMRPACFAALQFQIGYIYLTELGNADKAKETFRALEKDAYADQPFARLAQAVMKDREKEARP